MTVVIHYLRDGKMYKYTLGNDLPRSAYPIRTGKKIEMRNKEKEVLRVDDIIVDLHYPVLKCTLVQESS